MEESVWPAAGVFLMSLMAFLVYFLPWLQAKSRKHHQTTAIGTLNLLLGWTVLGWIAAMVWANTSIVPTLAAPTRRPARKRPPAPPPEPTQAAKSGDGKDEPQKTYVID